MLRFRTKYHPDEYTSRHDDARKILKQRCRVFMKLLELDWLANVSVDIDHTDELIRILDAGVVMHYCYYWPCNIVKHGICYPNVCPSIYLSHL